MCKIKTTRPCPCGSGRTYGSCCLPQSCVEGLFDEEPFEPVVEQTCWTTIASRMRATLARRRGLAPPTDDPPPWADPQEEEGVGAGPECIQTNLDGDPYQYTADAFEFNPPDRAEIVRLLRTRAGVRLDLSRRGNAYVYFEKAIAPPGPCPPADLVGMGLLRAGDMVVFTNSDRRATWLSECLLQVCGRLLRPAGRTQEPPQGASPPEPPSLDWLDTPLRGLDGMTPRDAIRTRLGRLRTGGLLKEMEEHAGPPEETGTGGPPPAERVDVAALRRLLGFPP